MRDFSEKFKNLINEDVPRKGFIRSEYDLELTQLPVENLPEPEDGFIAKYCREY